MIQKMPNMRKLNELIRNARENGYWIIYFNEILSEICISKDDVSNTRLDESPTEYSDLISILIFLVLFINL